MHVSSSFEEAYLVKAALQIIFTIDFAPQTLASLYFCTSILKQTL